MSFVPPAHGTYSTIGLSDFVIAQFLDVGKYGNVMPVAGAIEATVTHGDNGTPMTIYHGDSVAETLMPEQEITFRTKLVDVPLHIQQMIFNHRIDSNGILYRSTFDEVQYFAVGFRAKKSNGKYRYVWLYKVRPKLLTENYGSIGTSVTLQTPEIEWTVVTDHANTHDVYQAVADEGENGFTENMAMTFLDSVPTVPSDGSLQKLYFSNITLEQQFEKNRLEYTAVTTVSSTILYAENHFDPTNVGRLETHSYTLVTGVNTIHYGNYTITIYKN